MENDESSWILYFLKNSNAIAIINTVWLGGWFYDISTPVNLFNFFVLGAQWGSKSLLSNNAQPD